MPCAIFYLNINILRFIINVFIPNFQNTNLENIISYIELNDTMKNNEGFINRMAS